MTDDLLNARMREADEWARVKREKQRLLLERCVGKKAGHGASIAVLGSSLKNLQAPIVSTSPDASGNADVSGNDHTSQPPASLKQQRASRMGATYAHFGEPMADEVYTEHTKDMLGADLIQLLTERSASSGGAIDRPMFRMAMYDIGIDKGMDDDDIHALFDTLNRNGGGQVQVEELANVLNWIANPDVDVTASGGGSMASAHAKAPPKGVINALTDLMAGNGRANPVQALRDSLSSQAARFIDLFKRWDTNHNGIISKKEFARGASELGLSHCLPSEIEMLFDIFDHDHSGHISFKELHRMLRNAGKGAGGPKPWSRKASGYSSGHQSVQPLDLSSLRAQTRSNVLLMSIKSELQGHTIIVDGAPLALPPLTENIKVMATDDAAMNQLETALQADLDRDGDVGIVGEIGNLDGQICQGSLVLDQSAKGLTKRMEANELATNLFENVLKKDLDADGDIAVGEYRPGLATMGAL